VKIEEGDGGGRMGGGRKGGEVSGEGLGRGRMRRKGERGWRSRGRRCERGVKSLNKESVQECDRSASTGFAFLSRD
jgi:hypothetical protein